MEGHGAEWGLWILGGWAVRGDPWFRQTLTAMLAGAARCEMFVLQDLQLGLNPKLLNPARPWALSLPRALTRTDH